MDKIAEAVVIAAGLSVIARNVAELIKLWHERDEDE